MDPTHYFNTWFHKLSWIPYKRTPGILRVKIYLESFENVYKRVSFHKEKFFGKVRLEELEVADAVALERQGCLVGAFSVVGDCKFLRRVVSHMECLEPVSKLLHRNVSVRSQPIAPVLFLIFLRSHLTPYTYTNSQRIRYYIADSNHFLEELERIWSGGTLDLNQRT